MTMDEPESTGRKPRVGESGAPVGSVLSIVLAVVAVVIGFVILKQINDDSESAADGNGTGGAPAQPNPDDGDQGDGPSDSTPSSESTTTTEPPFKPVFKGATVVVANANGGPGAAGEMSEKLASLNFNMGRATDAANTNTPKSVVYYVEGNAKAQAVAETVARSFGQKNVPVQPMPAKVPTSSGQIDGQVLLLYGKDLVDVDPQAPSEG